MVPDSPASKTGSSPHMRGAHVTYQPDVTGLGIIPAYAGSTRRIWQLSRSCRDHPRICGEHSGASSLSNVSSGSSPHMRGAPSYLLE